MATVHIKRVLIAAFAVIVIFQWLSCFITPHGDFQLHWDDGMRMRTGQLPPGKHVPYPPAWAAFHVPISWMPLGVAKGVFFTAGLAGLLGLLWILNDLTKAALPLRIGVLFWVTAATLLACSRFITRDFDDGGQNLFLFALAWLGIWLFAKGRPISGGASLGLAIALKLTAAIFVLYFLVKREWRMTAASLAWTAVFFFGLPLPWLAPAKLAEHVHAWKNNIIAGMKEPDPSRGVLGDEPIANKSLRPTLARYLMHLPSGHLGRHPHRGYLEFADFTPATAGWIIKCVLIAGLLALGWLLRKSLSPGENLTLVQEASVVSVAMLLYSPITWGQHCVAALPALYFLIRGTASGRFEARRATIWIACILLPIFLTNRGIIGKDLSLLMESYHITTFALIGLLLAAANAARLRAASASVSQVSPPATAPRAAA